MVSSLQAVPYSTAVVLAVEAMGRKSLRYLSSDTSWASSISSSRSAVAPTTLDDSSAERKWMAASPSWMM